jgi:hypothetical protein
VNNLLDLIKEHIDHVESGAEDQVKEALKYFQNTKASVKVKSEQNDRYKEININIL